MVTHPHAGTSSCVCRCHVFGLKLVEAAALLGDDFVVEVDCSRCDCGGSFVVEVPPEGDAGQGPTKWDARGPAPAGSRTSGASRGASFFKRPEG